MRLWGAGAGIGDDAVAEGSEVDAACVEVVKEFEEVSGVAAESVEFPDNDFIAFTGAVQRPFRFGTAGFGSTDSVVKVDLFTTGGFQFPDLRLDVLVHGADSCVSKTRHETPVGVSHQRPFSLVLRISE